MSHMSLHDVGHPRISQCVTMSYFPSWCGTSRDNPRISPVHTYMYPSSPMSHMSLHDLGHPRTSQCVPTSFKSHVFQWPGTLQTIPGYPDVCPHLQPPHVPFKSHAPNIPWSSGTSWDIPGYPCSTQILEVPCPICPFMTWDITGYPSVSPRVSSLQDIGYLRISLDTPVCTLPTFVGPIINVGALCGYLIQKCMSIYMYEMLYNCGMCACRCTHTFMLPYNVCSMPR